MKNVLAKFKISSRKDWIIFWIFATLILYAVAYNLDTGITYWLRDIGNPWLWEGNEPQSYGRMIITVVMLAVVAEVVCFLRHKQLAVKLAVLAGGLLLPVLLVGMYFLNCRLIVSVIWQEKPGVNVYIRGSGDNRTYMPNEEEAARLLEYCRNLTIVSDEKVKEEFMQWYWDTKGKDFRSTTEVNLYFPRKYGHNVMFEVQSRGDYLYFFRGHGKGNDIIVTLFEDNGLTAYLKELEQKQAEALE